jgi:hypothetical protein
VASLNIWKKGLAAYCASRCSFSAFSSAKVLIAALVDAPKPFIVRESIACGVSGWASELRRVSFVLNAACTPMCVSFLVCCEFSRK